MVGFPPPKKNHPLKKRGFPFIIIYKPFIFWGSPPPIFGNTHKKLDQVSQPATVAKTLKHQRATRFVEDAGGDRKHSPGPFSGSYLLPKKLELLNVFLGFYRFLP